MAMTDAVAADLLARVREGQPIRSLTDRAGSPFSSWHFRKYCAAHPDYHATVLAASKANEVAKKSVNGQRRFGNKTHCPKGHEYSGENVGMKLSRGRPSRFCKVCSRLAAATVRPMTAEQIERVKMLVAQNVPQTKMVQGGALHVTGHQNIAYQRSIDPAFDRLMAEAAARRIAANIKLMHKRKAILRARREADDYRQIRAMMPAYLPDQVRDDVVQDVMRALLERTITRDQVKSCVRMFIAEHNRAFPVKFAKFGGARLVSLDEVVFDGGAATRGDFVSEGLWA